jgi:hypothetical protein
MEWDTLLAEFEKRFDRMPLHEKLLLTERLIRRVRNGALFDAAEVERQLGELAADEDLLRGIGMGGGLLARQPDGE